MKPKLNYKADAYKPTPIDSCETPPYAVAPLLPYLWDVCKDNMVWECAAGSGILANALSLADLNVIETDILEGHNFFINFRPPSVPICTNPPYGIKYKWIERCYQIGNPFALLMPLETLGAAGAIKFAKQYGMEVMILYPRVCFKMSEAGWYSSSQFPTAWFCHNILPEKLMFAKVYPPARSVMRIVTRVNRKGETVQVKQTGYPDWIEDPSYYDWDTERFVYEQKD